MISARPSMVSGSASKQDDKPPVRGFTEELIREHRQRSPQLMREDIESAWKVLVPNGESSITRTDLVDRLSYYFPHVDLGAVTSLLGGGGSMTHDKLVRLLWHDGQPALPCNVSDEAWQQLDPHGRGSVSLDTLLRMLTTISTCEKLDAEDMAVIRMLLDMPPDGDTVTDENWQQLGSWAPRLAVISPAQRKLLAARAGNERQFNTAGRKTFGSK
ncbi:hypothetical protein Agub_g980 [Astrephomene gubernaculifera]|uniref:Uncharacterized protein n=1 Tax=Astrephomene gubernaculifera TaxID=47775 RepID=A0AAD3DEN8_9CHLO|nr:hypothetical protein Agub_g980 [Astrephomene gubernaculifera]